MPLDIGIVQDFLVGTLGGNVAGVADRVYGDAAPRGALMPYIIFSLYTGEDVNALGVNRIFVNGDWLVKAVDNSPGLQSCVTVADAIDDLLQNASLQSTEGSIIGVYRIRPIAYSEVDQGTIYRHIGGIYRIFSKEV